MKLAPSSDPPANPSLHPTFASRLRRLSPAGELKRQVAAHARHAMPIKLPGGRIAIRTTLIERVSGAEHVLFEREGSSCHFAEERIHGNHLLCLRIDWRDLELGEPTLDADIYEYRDGKRGRKLPNRQWHHTKLPAQSGGLTNVYTFTFRDLTLELTACKSLAVSASIDAYIVDSNAEGPAAT